MSDQYRHREIVERLGGKVADMLVGYGCFDVGPAGNRMSLETMERCELFGWNLRTLIGVGVQLYGWDADSNVTLGMLRVVRAVCDDAVRRDPLTAASLSATTEGA